MAWQAYDSVCGRALLRCLGPQQGSPSLLMDRAYEGDATRALAGELGYRAVVPPMRTRPARSSSGEGRRVFRSPLSGFADAIAKPTEVVRIGGVCRRRRRAFEVQAHQALAILVLADPLVMDIISVPG